MGADMHSSGWAWYRDDDEAHHREDNARFRAVLGHCPKCIAVLDERGDLVGYNEEFKELFDAPPPIGGPVAKLFDEGPRAMLAEVVANAGTQRRAGAILTMRTTAHGEREVEFLVATLPGDDAPRSIGVVMAADDHTARDLAEGQRMILARGVGEANCTRAIDLAQSALCHDLNNVLTVLTLAMATLRKGTGDGGQTSELLREVDAAIHHGRSIVARARAHGRGPTAVVAATPETTSVRESVTEAVAVVAPLARLARATLVTRVAGDAQVPLAGAELTQVLTNVLTNAVHAIEDARRPGRVEVTVDGAGGPGASVTIGVRDDGIGIEPSRLVDSFEAFQTTRAASGGTGLGLAIAREIVEAAGGHINVVSTPGSGTQMRIELPTAEAVAAALEGGAARTGAPA